MGTYYRCRHDPRVHPLQIGRLRFAWVRRQVVRRRRPAEREEEVAPLLRRRAGRAVRRGPQHLRPDANGRALGGTSRRKPTVLRLRRGWAEFVPNVPFSLLEPSAGKSRALLVDLRQRGV